MPALEPSLLVPLAIAAFVLGAAKTSFPSAGVVVVPFLAAYLGARTARGILMPIYVFADLVAITSYRHGIQLRTALRLLPGTIAGVVVGVIVGNHLNAHVFNRVLGAVILVTVILSLVWRGDASNLTGRVPRWAVPPIGVTAGFATMIGNSAGPVVNLYLILGGLTKEAFVGTASVFYFMMNFSKIPLHLWVWHSVGPEMFVFSALVLPAAIVGTFAGRWLLPRVPANTFRVIVLSLTAAAALRLLIAPG